MAFIDIKDPSKRREIVQEYIQMRKELKIRNENAKEDNLLKEQVVQEQFRPIIAATKESAEKITTALKRVDTPYDFYFRQTKNRDKYFSIYRENSGVFKLGQTEVQIDENNTLRVFDKSYNYTPGFWALIMQNKPEDYTEEDLVQYVSLIKLVDLVNNPRELTEKSNPKGTQKYKFLTDLLKEGVDVMDTEVAGSSKASELEDEPMSKKRKVVGEGIILPGDISGLLHRLRLVCGERAAGNIKATTPEIVAILDELLRREYLRKDEYNAVCQELGC